MQGLGLHHQIYLNFVFSFNILFFYIVRDEYGNLRDSGGDTVIAHLSGPSHLLADITDEVINRVSLHIWQ